MTRLLSTLVLGVLVACSPSSTSHESSTPRSVGAEGARVEVADVYASPAVARLSLTGEVRGSRDANLASALGGFVEAVRVQTGEAVSKGQLLVAIDRDLHAAAHRQAAAQAALAADEHERLRRMGDAVSASQLQQAETQRKVADAALAQAAVRLRRASIVAPFDGVVSAVVAEEGEVAGPGMPILRIVQLDPVRVVVSASDRDVVSLEPGLPVSVNASAVGQAFRGEIAHISPVGDGNTRAFRVEAKVANPEGRLLPGMVARVGLERPLGDAVVVPTDWVIATPDGHGVFVEVDGVARWREVTLGQILQNRVIVERGVEPGTAVIMVGHRELIDGDPVIVARRGRCCTEGRVTYGADGVN